MLVLMKCKSAKIKQNLYFIDQSNPNKEIIFLCFNFNHTTRNKNIEADKKNFDVDF